MSSKGPFVNLSRIFCLSLCSSSFAFGWNSTSENTVSRVNNHFMIQSQPVCNFTSKEKIGNKNFVLIIILKPFRSSGVAGIVLYHSPLCPFCYIHLQPHTFHVSITRVFPPGLLSVSNSSQLANKQIPTTLNVSRHHSIIH